jgi:predicted HTH domain antitoxin
MIQFHLPRALEDELRSEWGGDLNQTAKEALLIESYRNGKLSFGELTEVLGLATRFDTEKWLGDRGVAWNYDPSDLAADTATLDVLLGKKH